MAPVEGPPVGPSAVEPPAIEPVAITPMAPQETLPRLGFSIQAGAFADAENAALRVEILAECGLEAFHFAGDDGFHKVRFGSFSTREAAIERAEALKKDRIIEDYYIVAPEPSGLERSEAGFRAKVVNSAMEFLGTPYRWGGPSADTGFDCSGLTMTAYRLHGLALPRASADQYATGQHVTREGLRDADLVFFATGGGQRPSHVGLYIGQGRFIHAPGSGKVVRIDDLSQDYYAQRFLGGRSYLE
jgi:cell wall-associated NlpC family hydrolase